MQVKFKVCILSSKCCQANHQELRPCQLPAITRFGNVGFQEAGLLLHGNPSESTRSPPSSHLLSGAQVLRRNHNALQSFGCRSSGRPRCQDGPSLEPGINCARGSLSLPLPARQPLPPLIGVQSSASSSDMAGTARNSARDTSSQLKTLVGQLFNLPIEKIVSDDRYVQALKSMGQKDQARLIGKFHHVRQLDLCSFCHPSLLTLRDSRRMTPQAPRTRLSWFNLENSVALSDNFRRRPYSPGDSRRMEMLRSPLGG